MLSWLPWWSSYHNRMILVIQYLHVAPLSPNKFQFIPTYSSGGYVSWRKSSWLPWRPSWISKQNILAIQNLHVASMSQVSVHSDIWFGRKCCLKNFKTTATVAIFDIGMDSTGLLNKTFQCKIVNMVLPIVFSICFGCSLRRFFWVPTTYTCILIEK